MKKLLVILTICFMTISVFSFAITAVEEEEGVSYPYEYSTSANPYYEWAYGYYDASDTFKMMTELHPEWNVWYIAEPLTLITAPGMGFAAGATPAIGFIVPGNGEIDISFLEPGEILPWQYGSEDIEFEFTILKNNVQIWPTGTAPYTFGKNAVKLDPITGVSVAEGDVITFRIFSEVGSNLTIQPLITYYEGEEVPVTEPTTAPTTAPTTTTPGDPGILALLMVSAASLLAIKKSR